MPLMEYLPGLLLATILGGVIGLERQLSGKPAGLRTNLLICLGAAVYTIVSRQMAGSDSSTRIAAQIVTGVGFLGAGAIIQDTGGVHGLTTAATIWLVSGIGTACGASLYSLALITTLIAVVVLRAFFKLEVSMKNHSKKTEYTDTGQNHTQQHG
jgi:putative Mg2+ transporter-C (MgtC) family protein